MTESEIQTAILKDLAKQQAAGVPVRAWRANTGGALPLNELAPLLDMAARGVPIARVIASAKSRRFGVPGQADLCGVLRVGQVGVSLWIEVKSATGRQSPEQKAFQRMCEDMGAVYILARGVDDVRAGLAAATGGAAC